MITNTANVRVYRIRQDVDLNELISFLISEMEYNQIEFTDLIQETQGVKIQAFARNNTLSPDWVGMIKPYLKRPMPLAGFFKYDFITFIITKSKNQESHTFAFFSGAGYHQVSEKLDQTFGISVLEHIFDPKLNKIKSVAEKGIVGDILASRRFYRRPRPAAYEDDFGKYYQNIDVLLTDIQVRQGFPLFSGYRGKKMRSMISISGSTNLNIRTKINFIELILLVKDLAELVTTEPPCIFNKTLIPLTDKRDKEQIINLNEQVFNTLIDFCWDPVNHPLDFDFCHSDFESFFSSTACQLFIPGLTNNKGQEIEPIQTDDVYDLSSSWYIRELVKKIEKSIEFKNAKDNRDFIKEVLKSIRVVTIDDSGNPTTTGKLNDYLQQEIQADGVSYFLLDNRWYRIQKQFDNSLSEKYQARIGRNIRSYQFIRKWNGQDEAAYNLLYNDQPNSFYLHQIKVDHIELCDALVLDTDQKKVYFVHVKDGIGASIRDLTSQSYMAARIIEEEARTEMKGKINKLYEQGVSNHRINAKIVSQSDFVHWISSFKREYVLAIYGGNKSPAAIEKGIFESRIAKFSLIEFASAMRLSDWDFSICIVVA